MIALGVINDMLEGREHNESWWTLEFEMKYLGSFVIDVSKRMRIN
jgi:hypothetical protein